MADPINADAPDYAACAGCAPHYGAGDLVARVEGALRLAGLGNGVIPWDALAPLDQFHIGGTAAATVLAARHLASVHGRLVTGIDLSRPFIDLAAILTERTRLSQQVRCRVGDATRLPAGFERFDFVWMQHVAVNIADRRGLFSGIHTGTTT